MLSLVVIPEVSVDSVHLLERECIEPLSALSASTAYPGLIKIELYMYRILITESPHSLCLVWNKILLLALRLRSLLKYLLYEIHIKKNWKFVSQKSAEQIPVKCCSILCKVLYQALVIFYVNKFNLRQKYFTLARRTVLNDDFSPWAPCWWHSPVYKPRLYFTVSLD